MPVGTGKTVMLSALFRQLLRREEGNFSILLLAGRTDLVSYYAKALSERMGQTCSVEIAETRKALADRAAVPGTVLVSTAQKLLGGSATQNEMRKGETDAPYSASSRLLVVVEEVAYNYFGRIYRDMCTRFPNVITAKTRRRNRPNRRPGTSLEKFRIQGKPTGRRQS